MRLTLAPVPEIAEILPLIYFHGELVEEYPSVTTVTPKISEIVPNVIQCELSLDPSTSIVAAPAPAVVLPKAWNVRLKRLSRYPEKSMLLEAVVVASENIVNVAIITPNITRALPAQFFISVYCLVAIVLL